MSNPERRAQVRIEPKVSVPSSTRPAESWDDLAQGWDVPTVVDPKEKKPAPETGDTHDAAAMLDRARVAIKDPRLADQMVARVYAGEETAARAAQVGTRDVMEVDEADSFLDDATVSTETGAINWLEVDDDPSSPLFEDHQTNDGTLQGIPTMGAVPPFPTVPTIASPLPDNLSPTIASRDTQANPLPVAPPTNPKSSWISQTMQSMTDTVKGWGRRLGIIGALTTSTSMHVPEQSPTQSTAGNVSIEHRSQQQPSIFNSNSSAAESATQKQFTDTTAPNLPVAPLLGHDTPNDRVVNIPLPPAPQKPGMNADRPSVSSNQPSVIDVSTVVIPPAPQPAPQIDQLSSSQPSSESIIQQPTPIEVSKQLNADLGKAALSPEEQIDYLQNLFDALNTSKIFIRLSPTKRLELRQSASGDIAARFPGEKDFRSLTAEEIKGLGDLTKKPHYSR